MGDVVEMKTRVYGTGQPNESWMTTFAICFNCLETWVAVIEGDSHGKHILTHLQCGKCDQYKGVALLELMERFALTGRDWKSCVPPGRDA